MYIFHFNFLAQVNFIYIFSLTILLCAEYMYIYFNKKVNIVLQRSDFTVQKLLENYSHLANAPN